MLQALIATVNAFPTEFTQKVKIYEESIMQEIGQALLLNVIKFEPVRVVYTGQDKVITTYSASLSDDQKKQKLVDYFRTDAGIAAYEEFHANVEYAKKKQVENN